MNSGSKVKKRVVLPSRPEPPSVDQILEDLGRAAPQDPVFSVLESAAAAAVAAGRGPLPLPEGPSHQRFQEARRLLELGERLRDSGGRLRLQRAELESVGRTLDHDIAEVEGQTQ